MKNCKILLLEDSKSDAELIERELKKGGLTFTLKRVETEEEFSEELRQFGPNIILSDYYLPEFDGMSALDIVKKQDLQIPFIIVSGEIGDEFAVETIRRGATDYVLKDRLSRLIPAVTQALREVEWWRIKREVEQHKIMEIKKNEFSSMIVHELRNPLIPIIGYTQMFLDGEIGTLDEEKKAIIDIVHNNALLLNSLIDDLLDTNKLEIHQMYFNMKKISASYLIMQSINAFKPVAVKRNINLQHKIEKDIEILCDQNRMIQVINNLLTNALKFSPDNSGNILVTARSENNTVLFSVKDNGFGIPKDKQENLFRRFYQVDKSRQSSDRSSGLGLAICKGIVEAHNGTIWLQSEEDKGTTVYFTIPLDCTTIQNQSILNQPRGIY